jgi:hypothetical protein
MLFFLFANVRTKIKKGIMQAIALIAPSVKRCAAIKPEANSRIAITKFDKLSDLTLNKSNFE